MLENKLGITNSLELAKAEEQISKKKAVELFEKGILDKLEAGQIAALQAIHKHLFEDIYDFAGKLRTVNIAKGNFRFAPLMYLEAALASIDKMPQSTFDEIIEKYVEMIDKIKSFGWKAAFAITRECRRGNPPPRTPRLCLQSLSRSPAALRSLSAA